jgi:hypothetical protein
MEGTRSVRAFLKRRARVGSAVGASNRTQGVFGYARFESREPSSLLEAYRELEGSHITLAAPSPDPWTQVRVQGPGFLAPFHRANGVSYLRAEACFSPWEPNSREEITGPCKKTSHGTRVVSYRNATPDVL